MKSVEERANELIDEIGSLQYEEPDNAEIKLVAAALRTAEREGAERMREAIRVQLVKDGEDIHDKAGQGRGYMISAIGRSINRVPLEPKEEKCGDSRVTLDPPEEEKIGAYCAECGGYVNPPCRIHLTSEG